MTQFRPYIETAVASYFTADWLKDLDAYSAAVAFLASLFGG